MYAGDFCPLDLPILGTHSALDGRCHALASQAYSSPELYELLVIGRGWPTERYGTFVSQGLIAALLSLPQVG